MNWLHALVSFVYLACAYFWVYLRREYDHQKRIYDKYVDLTDPLLTGIHPDPPPRWVYWGSRTFPPLYVFAAGVFAALAFCT